MKNNAKDRMQDLRKKISRHNALYYTDGKPEISDAEYDKLSKELKELEKAHPEFASKKSPTQKIGSPVAGTGFAKIKHTSVMLSLESVNNEADCARFDATCKKDLGVERLDYMCEPKLDGLSIELVYEKGEFARGSTRGDGYIGEDVTHNLKTIKAIPRKLKGTRLPERLAVRGEVLMRLKDFNELNERQASEGKDIFANPRNAAAGSLRQIDPQVTAGRTLEVYCYDILDISGGMPETHEDAIDLIGKWGLKTAPGRKRVQNINEAVKYHHGSEARRDELDYEIDGIVIKVNRYAYHKELGLRTTTPRWAVAYKFEPRKEITRVEDIVIQVGRTGILTPVAFLMPVEVGGVTVSRANLHNMDEIARLGVKIGDYVKVQRAGDVIPDVVEVITPRRTGGEKEFHMPGKCPSCGAGVEKEDVFYRCPAGLSCPAQVKEAVIHYSSKGAADIAGFSDATCAQFYEADLVKRISDIYILKKDDILKLEGWKDKKADNLLAAIERSKAITLDRFIYGLGIRNVGKHIGSLLAEKMGSLEKLMKATVDEMTGIKEIGPETAKSVADFFSARNNAIEVGKLIEYGVKVNPKALKGKLAGKKIVFTGSLRSMERSQAEKIVADEGGEALSSVSSGTDFVVAGEKAGSKVDSARKKGIRVISEEEFLSLIGKDAFNTSLF